MTRSPIAALLRAYGPLSFVRMGLWRFRHSPQALRVRRPDHSWIEMRGGRYAHSDRWIASEIFVNNQYVPPAPLELTDIKQIVDVGANVGYSLIYFLSTFPQATATAFEPHPAHIVQIRCHLKLNGLESRVKLYAAAAATESGTLHLTDSEAQSTVVGNENDGTTLAVPAVDWFACLPDGTIDILKMDIEGAEFALMSDPRFSDVLKRTRTMTLEWHVTHDHPDARQWCADRLTRDDFTVYDGSVQHSADCGTFWAARASTMDN